MLFVSFNTLTLKAQNKITIGRVEKVRIYPGNLIIRAKIDTGAKNSSLGCYDMSFFENNGEKWVRFSITNHKGKTIKLEQKVQRVAKIKDHFEKNQERPVIKLYICLGNLYKETEVNLIDRSGFIYQLLIGRSFITDDFIVDPSKKYTTKPKCKVKTVHELHVPQIFLMEEKGAEPKQ